ncbi:MAG: hypothetical protein KDH09_17890 [Chrysiogenetes bacterium]|nr:hypothetical protein [Chrysiogenetes bacterium]
MRKKAIMSALALGIWACTSGPTDAAPGNQAPAHAATAAAPAQAPLQLAQRGSLLDSGKKPHNELFEEAPIEVMAPPPLSARAGEHISLAFEFVPRAKVKVPIYPPAYLKDFSAYGDLKGPEGKVYARDLTPEEQEKGRLAYYEAAPPAVKIDVEVPAGIEPGSYPYRASVHYFYCYEAGGICAKEEATVEGIIDVAKEQDK